MFDRKSDRARLHQKQYRLGFTHGYRSQNIWNKKGARRYTTKSNSMTLLGKDTGYTLNKSSYKMNHQKDFRLGAWDGRFLLALAFALIAIIIAIVFLFFK